MALKWIEGFETFGSAGTDLTASGWPQTAVDRKYPDVFGYGMNLRGLILAGRSGGLCWDWADGFRSFYIPWSSASNTLIIGFAIKMNNLGAVMPLRIVSGDGSTELASLSLTNSDGTISVSTQTGSWTTSYAIAAGTWYHMELKFVAHDSAGSVTLRVNEVTRLTQTGLDTIPSPGVVPGQIYFRCYDCQIDDIYICDGSGTTNNDFLGDVVVEAITPSGVGSVTQFTVSGAANNYTAAGDATDSSYVTGASGNTDLYNYSNLNRINSSVKGMMVNHHIRRTDGNLLDFSVAVRSGGTTATSPAIAVPDTSVTHVGVVLEKNPVGNVDWTPTSVNAAEIGINVA